MPQREAPLPGQKNADWSTVLVRLPMPTFSGQVNSIDEVHLDVVLSDITLSNSWQVMKQTLRAAHWQFTRKVPPGLTSRTIGEALDDVCRGCGKQRSLALLM